MGGLAREVVFRHVGDIQHRLACDEAERFGQLLRRHIHVDQRQAGGLALLKQVHHWFEHGRALDGVGVALEIAADNPGVTLPATNISVAHRADGSGTTNNFTKYLVAAAPSWKLASGDTVQWPATTVGKEKNGGVAQEIKAVEGAIGYVDFADATAAGLTFAAIKNKDGQFVLPTLEGATAALAGAELKDDMTYNPLNAAGAATYPITAPTYLLVKPKYDDTNIGKAVKGFVTYVLTDGQALAQSVNFAKLPDSLQQKALAQLDKVEGAG